MVTKLDKAGVVSSGSTNERALEDRFADSINVKDYGAVEMELQMIPQQSNLLLQEYLGGSSFQMELIKPLAPLP